MEWEESDESRFNAAGHSLVSDGLCPNQVSRCLFDVVVVVVVVFF